VRNILVMYSVCSLHTVKAEDLDIEAIPPVRSMRRVNPHSVM